jgi:golgi-specific brefeldin A-resistance guanine nucleotide exchange factor 1
MLDTPQLFSRTLYPLLDALLDAPAGPEATEARVRTAALVCKAFMLFEIGERARRENDEEEVLKVWTRILDYLVALLQVDQSDAMAEAVPESLKNVVLVMNADGLLEPPRQSLQQQQQEQEKKEGEEVGDKRTDIQKLIWDVTKVRVENVLPGFLESVIPAAHVEEKDSK